MLDFSKLKERFTMKCEMKRAAVVVSIILMMVIGLALVSCPNGVEITNGYGITIKAAAQKGRYVVLEIGFADAVPGNDAALEARLSFENAEAPTQEAFDLYGQADNDVGGAVWLSEQAVSKDLVHVRRFVNRI